MANPAAVIVCAVAVLFIVIGFRGKSDNLLAALMGRPYGGSTLK